MKTSEKNKNLAEKNESMQSLTQWKKRVACFRFIYSVLVMNLKSKDSILKFNEELAWLGDKQMAKVIAYFIKNKNSIKLKIKSFLKENWDIDRLNKVDLAILMESFCEYQVLQIDRKIIIDQAIVTSKRYSEDKSYKFINFVLDKILIK